MLFHSENNLQEDLFDQILVGKLEFPSPYWDNITDSAKVLIYLLTLKSSSDKLLRRLLCWKRGIEHSQQKVNHSSSCCAFLVGLMVLDESSGLQNYHHSIVQVNKYSRMPLAFTEHHMQFGLFGDGLFIADSALPL